MLAAVWTNNDKKARILIFVFSVIVFTAIMLLSRVKLNMNAGFDVHLFAKANAIINSVVALLLIVALVAVKGKNTAASKPHADRDVSCPSCFW